MVDHHLQQVHSSSRGQQPYEQDADTFAMLHKNNKLFEAHRKYTDRINKPTQDASNSSSSLHTQKSNFLSSKPSDMTRHQNVTKTVSNSSVSTIDKMYVNPGFHLSYSPNGMNDNSSSNKNYSQNNELPSDVEICEVNDEDDMNLDPRSDNYERLRKYQIKNDNVGGDVSLVGDLPPIHQLSDSRKNPTNPNFPYSGPKQMQPTQKSQSGVNRENIFGEDVDFKLSTSSNNYRQTSTSTSNSSDQDNNSRHRDGGDIARLRGGVARNNQHGDFSKHSKMANRHSTSTASSNNSREASDPMSLDSGVITTLSRSVSPMSSSNPGSTGSQHSRGRRENLLSEKSNEIEEETNVDGSDNNAVLEDDDDDDQDVVDVADTSTDDSSSIGAGSTGELNATTRSIGSTYYKGGRLTGSLLLATSQKKEDSRKPNGIPSNQFVSKNRKSINENITVGSTSSIIGRNGNGMMKHDPLAKLYDNAVLKIPKMIPSDSDSLYSECNNYNKSGKRLGHALNSLDSKKHRLLLGNSDNDSGIKTGSSKANRRQRRKIVPSDSENQNITEDVGGIADTNAETNESSFDTEDHDNSYESIKCDGNLTNDEAVDTAADSEPGGDAESNHRALYINRYMSNSLNPNIPEINEEEFEDNDTNLQYSSKQQPAISYRNQQPPEQGKVNPYSKTISSMDKMIVKIGGSGSGDNAQDASRVYSGRLLIEVAGNDADYKKRNSNMKNTNVIRQFDGENQHFNGSNARPPKDSKYNNFRINGASFDPDTLDRGAMSSSEFPDDSLERPNKNKKSAANSSDKRLIENGEYSSSIRSNARENKSNDNSVASFNLTKSTANNRYATSSGPPSEVGSCSTITTNTGGNTKSDYSFRLFENGQLLNNTDAEDSSYGDQKSLCIDNKMDPAVGPTSLPSLPPALPPKQKSKSQSSLVQYNLYENEEVDLNEVNSTYSNYSEGTDNNSNSRDDSDDPEVAAAKRQRGLAAERKQYFERLNSGKDFGVSVDVRNNVTSSNSPRKLWETNCV